MWMGPESPPPRRLAHGMGTLAVSRERPQFPFMVLIRGLLECPPDNVASPGLELQEGGSPTVFCDLESEVTHWGLCRILLITYFSPDSVWEGTASQCGYQGLRFIRGCLGGGWPGKRKEGIPGTMSSQAMGSSAKERIGTSWPVIAYRCSCKRLERCAIFACYCCSTSDFFLLLSEVENKVICQEWGLGRRFWKFISISSFPVSLKQCSGRCH